MPDRAQSGESSSPMIIEISGGIIPGGETPKGGGGVVGLPDPVEPEGGGGVADGGGGVVDGGAATK